MRLALNHQEPDRVPINITFTSVPYLELRRELGLPEEKVHPDVWDRVIPVLDVVERMSCDCVQVGLNRPAHLARFDPARDSYTEENGVTFVRISRPAGGVHFEMREHPIKEPSFDLLDRYHWPDPHDRAAMTGWLNGCGGSTRPQITLSLPRWHRASGRRATSSVDRPGG